MVRFTIILSPSWRMTPGRWRSCGYTFSQQCVAADLRHPCRKRLRPGRFRNRRRCDRSWFRENSLGDHRCHSCCGKLRHRAAGFATPDGSRHGPNCQRAIPDAHPRPGHGQTAVTAQASAREVPFPAFPARRSFQALQPVQVPGSPPWPCATFRARATLQLVTNRWRVCFRTDPTRRLHAEIEWNPAVGVAGCAQPSGVGCVLRHALAVIVRLHAKLPIGKCCR